MTSTDRVLAVLLAVIVVVGLVPRLHEISLPILTFHAWRQCDTAAIARNILRSGFDVFHPQVDYHGRGPTYAETEFQFYGLVVALCYAVVGVHEVVGRLVSLAFFLATLPPLLYLTRRLVGTEGMPFCLLFVMASPLYVAMSRAFQPDATMVCCMIWALALFWHYLDGGDRRVGAATAVALALTLLTKVSGAFVGVAFVALCLVRHGIGFLKRRDLWAIALVGTLPAVAWYAFARSFPVSFNMWTLGPQHLRNWFGWYSAEYHAAFTSHFVGFALTVPVAALAVIGLVGLLATTTGAERAATVGCCIGATMYMALTSNHMIRHSYYCLPVVPFVALLAAWPPAAAVRLLARRRPGPYTAVVALFALLVLIGWPVGRLCKRAVGPLLYRLDDTSERVLRLARTIRQRTAPDDLVVTSMGHGLPEILYYADRRGWHLPFEQTSRARLAGLRDRGARWYAQIQPLLPGLAADDGDDRSLAQPFIHLATGGYEANCCVGAAFGFNALAPLDRWLSTLPKDDGLLCLDIFQSLVAVVHTGKGLDQAVDALDLEAFIQPLRRSGETTFAVVPALLASPRFKLTWIGDGGLLFLRCEGRLRERALREAYEYLDPLNRHGTWCRLAAPDRKTLERCLAEARRARAASPDSVITAVMAAYFCSSLGLYDEGYRILDSPTLIAKAPETCLVNMAIFAHQAGKNEEARKLCQNILHRFPENERARHLLSLPVTNGR